MIYFISDGELVKVGFALSVESRILDIQCGNGRKIAPICTAPGTMKMERELHAILPARQNGEWFAPSRKLLRLLRIVATTAPGARERCIPDFIANERVKQARFLAAHRLRGDRMVARLRRELSELIEDLAQTYGPANLARAIGYSEGAIQFWLRGETRPSAHAVLCIGAYFPDRVSDLVRPLGMQRLANSLLARAEALGIAA